MDVQPFGVLSRLEIIAFGVDDDEINIAQLLQREQLHPVLTARRFKIGEIDGVIDMAHDINISKPDLHRGVKMEPAAGWSSSSGHL